MDHFSRSWARVDIKTGHLASTREAGRPCRPECSPNRPVDVVLAPFNARNDQNVTFWSRYVRPTINFMPRQALHGRAASLLGIKWSLLADNLSKMCHFGIFHGKIVTPPFFYRHPRDRSFIGVLASQLTHTAHCMQQCGWRCMQRTPIKLCGEGYIKKNTQEIPLKTGRSTILSMENPLSDIEF